MRNPVWPSSCVTPAGTSNELNVQNKWEENTHTHTPCMKINLNAPRPSEHPPVRGKNILVLVPVLMYVCVCVCVFSSHSFWTSSSLDVPAGVTQEEGHTGFLIHLLSAVRWSSHIIAEYGSTVWASNSLYTLLHTHPCGSVRNREINTLLTLGRKFESRCGHTNWDFSSQ